MNGNRFIATLILIVVSSLTMAQQQKFISRVNGLSGPVLENVKKRLSLMTADVGTIEKNRAQYFYQQGIKEIKKAMAPYGYFAPVISGEIDRQDSNWLAIYQVALGMPLKITQLNIKLLGEGGDNKFLRQYLELTPLKKGNVFTTARYEEGISQLLERAQSLGYLDAKFIKNSIIINRQTYGCVINIVFDTGSRYYFGGVSFSPSPFSNQLLQRYIPFKRGDVYNNQALLKLQRLLSKTDYFKTVVVTAERNKSKQQEVPIAVMLQKNKRKSYQIGLGYGTGTGARATLGTHWRWVNHQGHSFKIQSQLSQVNNHFSAQYIIPGRNPISTQYRITATGFQLSPKDANSIGQRLGITYAHKFNLWNNLYELNYLHERYRFNSDGNYQTASGIIPTIIWERHRANQLLNPSYFNQLKIILRGSYQGLASNFSFAQTDLHEKLLLPIRSSTHLLLRGQWGYTAVSTATDLPVSISFFTGGAQSVRGYNEQTLGPGRFLLTASVELRQRLIGNWWGTTFVDEGNAFNHFGKRDLKRGIGIGLLWHSPVGAISLSIAQANSDPDKPLRLQFSVGLV